MVGRSIENLERKILYYFTPLSYSEALLKQSERLVEVRPAQNMEGFQDSTSFSFQGLTWRFMGSYK